MGTEKKVVHVLVGYSNVSLEEQVEHFAQQLKRLGISVERRVVLPHGSASPVLLEEKHYMIPAPIELEFTEHQIGRQFSIDPARPAGGEIVRPPISLDCTSWKNQARISVCGQANTGKSTLIFYLEKLLREREDMEITNVRFNLLDEGMGVPDKDRLEKNLQIHLADRIHVNMVIYPLRRSRPVEGVLATFLKVNMEDKEDVRVQ